MYCTKTLSEETITISIRLGLEFYHGTRGNLIVVREENAVNHCGQRRRFFAVV